MVEIKLFETNTFYLGQEAFVTIKEHGSVGIKSAAISSDDAIISVVSTRFSRFKSVVFKGTGGDEGEKTYVFKANKTGAAVIKLQQIYRGRLQQEQKINITVIP